MIGRPGSLRAHLTNRPEQAERYARRSKKLPFASRSLAIRSCIAQRSVSPRACSTSRRPRRRGGLTSMISKPIERLKTQSFALMAKGA